MPQSTKKVTRRDAIKLLGAATGAAMLANVPTKWSKPSLMSGVLPAHAQTSCISLHVERIAYTGTPDNSAIFTLNVDEDNFYAPDVFVEHIEEEEGYSSATWYCREGCAFFAVACNPGAPGTSMIAQVTTLSAQFTIEVVFDGLNVALVTVDLGTGDYAINEPLAGACDITIVSKSLNKLNPWNK
jgi:hypothetical protein